MKKVTVVLTQQLSLPASCEIVDSPTGKLVRINGKDYFPRVEWWVQADPKVDTLTELDEDSFDLFFAAVTSEQHEIK